MYQKITLSYDSQKAFNDRVDQANVTRDGIIKLWKDAYESFWQTPRTHSDKAISITDLQATIDQNQVEIGTMLSDAGEFLEFVMTSYPEAFGDDDSLVPPRYLAYPYDYAGTAGVDLTLTGLKPEWENQQV
jgi:hypothetical protein